jgi:hypothetical protein
MYCGECSQKIWAISVNFIKLPKVNKDPKGENSPNLVTLVDSQALSFAYLCGISVRN